MGFCMKVCGKQVIRVTVTLQEQRQQRNMFYSQGTCWTDEIVPVWALYIFISVLCLSVNFEVLTGHCWWVGVLIFTTWTSSCPLSCRNWTRRHVWPALFSPEVQSQFLSWSTCFVQCCEADHHTRQCVHNVRSLALTSLKRLSLFYIYIYKYIYHVV